MTTIAESDEASADARQQVVELMRENGDRTRRLLRERLKGMDLRRAEGRALMYLGANQGSSQNQLAELLYIQPIVLSRTVDALEAKGYVQRRHHPTDGRVRLLHLTPRGKSLVRTLLALRDELNNATMAGFADAELRQLADFLQKMNATLRDMT
jgi:MarR family transcriptional regulator for hemolysin